MEKNLEELESIMKQEIDLHNSLLVVAREFNTAIKENDLELIRKKTTEQDEHICSIERLEDSRQECCRSLSDQLNLEAKSVKFSHIIDFLPSSWKNRLTRVHSSLKSIIGELTSINTSNRILLEEADRIIGKTLTYFTQPPKVNNSYSNQGKIPQNRNEFIFYNNVI
ncbi:MAG TPA: flagellar protein FlgN [Chitinispirillaceae bacterium]|nr:flagellar protein FlgN [Chitinispirillaceae bacterium]